MAYNHEYPYTDPDRYNSDWEINQVKLIGERLDSYEELAHELQEELSHINELDARVTNLESTVKLLDVLQADIKTLQYNFKTLSDTVNSMQLAIDSIDARFRAVYNYVDSVARELDIKINNRIYDIRQELYTSNAQLTAQIKALRAYIEEVEKKSSANVLNNIIGSRVTLDDNNKEINMYLRYGGLTESQLMELGLTETELESYNLTQRDFAYNGRKFLKELFIFSPVSGSKVPYYMALSDVLTHLCDTMTEAERVTANWTESDLESLDLTAIQWLTYKP